MEGSDCEIITILYRLLPKGAEENHVKPARSQSVRDLNPGPPKYEAGCQLLGYDVQCYAISIGD
jgi:hypothetical protein